LEFVAQETDGYSCSDMKNLVKAACYEPLLEAKKATTWKMI